MITPWEIYWVLQLDSICSALLAICFISGFGVIGIGIAWVMALDADIGSPDVARAIRPIALYILPSVFAVALVVSALLPSTKTAAAMIVVPKIVNSPTIQHEAGDLYKLAKEALSNAIAPQHKDKQ